MRKRSLLSRCPTCYDKKIRLPTLRTAILISLRRNPFICNVNNSVPFGNELENLKFVSVHAMKEFGEADVLAPLILDIGT